jgi:hypothetical protein
MPRTKHFGDIIVSARLNKEDTEGFLEMLRKEPRGEQNRSALVRKLVHEALVARKSNGTDFRAECINSSND